MYAILMATFTINKNPSFVSINLPYIRIRHGISFCSFISYWLRAEWDWEAIDGHCMEESAHLVLRSPLLSSKESRLSNLTT